MFTRREILKILGTVMGMVSFGKMTMAKQQSLKETSDNPLVSLYRSVNGNPETNLEKVIHLLGGIEMIIGPHDVVVIKPNVQWWNQGVPNLSALKRFIDLIMNRPGGFNGEVVLAENCHRGPTPWKHAGWAAKLTRNSDLKKINNFNDLSQHLKKKYNDRFSTSHLINVESGAKRVFSPADGPGYVYCDGSGGVPLISLDNGAQGDNFRSAIMTYPILKTDIGTLIDFKNGIWDKGSYTGRFLKFINFAALNHHSTHCGATSAIKNYLGISDLSGGADPHNGGRLTEQYYNFHSFPFNKWEPGPVPGMIGAEIAVFMNTIRKADLNITTAEWVGLSSRTETPVARTRAVLACKDPVALDYHSTKYILFPNSKIAFHNPDDVGSPLNQYLTKCAEHGGGEIDESKVAVKSWDFEKERLQRDDELVILGEKEWGRDFKTLLKYFYLRYFWYG
jgi:hypothetical protein